MLINFWVHEGTPVTKNKKKKPYIPWIFLIINLNVDTALKPCYAMLNMNL